MSECLCPVNGCENRKRTFEFVCLDHWFSLPSSIRSNIYWLAGTKGNREAYNEARVRALAKLNREAAAEDKEP